MTPRIPLYRCRRCVHYRRATCQLPDLDPCNFERSDGRTPRRLDVRTIAAVILILAGLAIIALSCRQKEDRQQPVPLQSAVKLLRQQHQVDLDPCNFAPINGKTRPRWWARAKVYIIAAL